jgi:hypothetical protein
MVDSIQAAVLNTFKIYPYKIRRCKQCILINPRGGKFPSKGSIKYWVNSHQRGWVVQQLHPLDKMLSECRYLTAGRLLTKSPPSSVVFVLLDIDVAYSSHFKVFLYNVQQWLSIS